MDFWALGHGQTTPDDWKNRWNITADNKWIRMEWKEAPEDTPTQPGCYLFSTDGKAIGFDLLDDFLAHRFICYWWIGPLLGPLATENDYEINLDPESANLRKESYST